MQYIINFFVGLFRGWYAEYSRDKAHSDLGKAKAEIENEKQTASKIADADNAKPDLSPPGLSDDKNSTDY